MRQKDEMERTENARARSNRHILWLTYGIAALFIAMAVYFGWFIQFKSENVIGSSYNARLDLLSDRVTRGSIMSNDKTVLAQTNVASDGSEKRYYPYDYLFVHSVGYSGKNGKTGLESLANFYLLSSHVNLIEKTINEFQGQKNLGDNVITTLDVDLQQTASDAIGKHRGAVIVMEPVRGGSLANLSDDAKAVFDELHGGSPATYAIRYAAGFPGIMMVLSGMSTIDQMKENLDFMKDFRPLDEKEAQAVEKVCEIIQGKKLISCTGCRYCVDGCPKKILIPDLFACMNAKKMYKNWNSDYYYEIHTKEHGKASDCIKCGKCEQICPQQLKIRDLLCDVAAEFEKKEA